MSKVIDVGVWYREDTGSLSERQSEEGFRAAIAALDCLFDFIFRFFIMNLVILFSNAGLMGWRLRASLGAVLFCASCGCEARYAGSDGPAPLEVWAVRTDEERPVAGVEVRALLFSGKELVSRYTGPDGQARWEYAEGDLVVRIEDPEGRYYPQERVVRNPRKQVFFKMREGVSSTLEIRSAGRLPGPGGGVGERRARSPFSGSAVPKAGPTLAIQAHVEAWPLDGAVIRSATGSDGRVTLAPLPLGDVKLLVSAEGHVRTVLDFTLTSGENALGRIVLQPGGVTLKGSFQAGEPPTDFSFRFRGVSVKVAASSDGSFEITGLPVGRGTLICLRERRELFRLPVDVRGRVLDLGEIDPELVAIRQ